LSGPLGSSAPLLFTQDLDLESLNLASGNVHIWPSKDIQALASRGSAGGLKASLE
jgi:hypothetical protein